jgi:hypothetical protein
LVKKRGETVVAGTVLTDIFGHPANVKPGGIMLEPKRVSQEHHPQMRSVGIELQSDNLAGTSERLDECDSFEELLSEPAGNGRKDQAMPALTATIIV